MKTVACPRCQKAVPWSAENRFRPFCSERCKHMDLGAWANDEYRIAHAEPPDYEPAVSPKPD
ncbi:MAG: DNA gyrase inhibitor YacG [Burkholderiales bacterium]|uniref:DNA gyrase inhibitor YacG n=1 Tax=Casimicrobium huifangae TaxID=2591109 RepID=UPI0012EBD1B4|nr:DNA gyrase inhibitor YacG [Casimicrobium huifangae]